MLIFVSCKIWPVLQLTMCFLQWCECKCCWASMINWHQHKQQFPFASSAFSQRGLADKGYGSTLQIHWYSERKNGPLIPRWKSCEQNTLLFALWVVIQKLAQLSQVWMIGWNRFCVLLKLKNTGGSSLNVPFLRNKRNIAVIHRIPYQCTSLQPINSTFITLLPNFHWKDTAYFCMRWCKLRRAIKQL